MFSKLKSFKQRDDGVAAVEFAIVSIPFFLLIMGIIEIGIMFAAATILEGATEDAARMIRTGQAQESADAEATFTARLCDELHILIDCPLLRFHIIPLDDGAGEDFEFAFGDPTILPPVVDSLNPSLLTPSTTGANFDPGVQNDRVIVRVSYDYPLLTPLAGPLLSTRPNGKFLLVSTAVIQNEPY